MIISRYHNQEKIDFELEFLTPAFLGGASQHAELRSAPFKGMLRYWWRMTQGPIAYNDLLVRESELFGTAGYADKNASKPNPAQKSIVTIALKENYDSSYYTSSYTAKPGQISIPKLNGKTQPINPFLYLGYGPISLKDGWKRFVTPGKKIQLSICFPKNKHDEIIKTLQFMHYFAGLGGRSRNAWGAFTLSSGDYELDQPLVVKTCFLEEALAHKNYPWTLGKDKTGLLCWKTQASDSWEGVLKKIARIYATLRYNTPEMKDVNARAILGYPLKNAKVKPEKIERIPKQLKMTVHRSNEGKLFGVFTHFPFKLPADLCCAADEKKLWEKIHNYFDNTEGLSRYSTIVKEAK